MECRVCIGSVSIIAGCPLPMPRGASFGSKTGIEGRLEREREREERRDAPFIVREGKSAILLTKGIAGHQARTPDPGVQSSTI